MTVVDPGHDGGSSLDLNINITNCYDNTIIKDLPSMPNIKGVVLYCNPQYFTLVDNNNKMSATQPSINGITDLKFSSENGKHISIDNERLDRCVPYDKQTKHLTGGEITYIGKALYGDEPNESSLSVVMLVPLGQNYEYTEKRTFKYLADFLVSRSLTPDDVMRAFDIDKEPSPLHLLETDKWHAFIDNLKTVYEEMKKDRFKFDDKLFDKITATYKNDEIKQFYYKHKDDYEDYAKGFEPDHRDIQKIKDYEDNNVIIKSFTTKNNTIVNYTVKKNVPGTMSHCNREFDSLTDKASNKLLDVEPIYPDLIIPPGQTSTFVSNLNENKVIESNNVLLTVEELAKTQKIFNIKDYMDAEKKIVGKPINNNDPFPIDDKIAELESHQPKLKIDEVNSKLHDTNHPGSVIGKLTAENFLMIQDEIITLSKRSERRIAKLENNMATIMRNLFRLGSRISINCVYYGGQSVYGKYKCIRCLQDDRINDGQIMTLDQCLCCTRYEPIEGQVYAILDESGVNMSQVMDDMQMAYMSKDDYVNFSRTEELMLDKNNADVTLEAETPKLFTDNWEEGFKMDWNKTSLESQRANVAPYELDNIKLNVPELKLEQQPTIPDEFKDTIVPEQESESIIYNIEDYALEGFADSYSDDYTGSGTIFGQGATEVRQKIIDYATNAYNLCQENKAGYSQDNRYNHLDNAINGISYWDCSSLAEGAYKDAGLTSIAGTTYTEYPKCLPSEGGILVHITKMDDALPGDLIFYTEGGASESQMANVPNGNIYHVAIYVGDGQYIAASTNKVPLNQQIVKSAVNTGGDAFCFARPKDLVDLDKAAAKLNVEGCPSFESCGYNDRLKKIAAAQASNVDATIERGKQYKYLDVIPSIAQANGFNPYLIAGIIATESAGDPTATNPWCTGLMQCNREYSDPRGTTNLDDIKHDIQLGCDILKGKFTAIKGYGLSNLLLALHAYNSGEDYPRRALNASGMSPEEFDKQNGQYYADLMLQVCSEEAEQYTAKVIYNADVFKQKKVFG